eukprot:gene6721-10886_t
MKLLFVLLTILLWSNLAQYGRDNLLENCKYSGSQNFDFLHFAQSWPASNCLLNNGTCEHSLVNAYFTIQGLWPSLIEPTKKNNFYFPQCCSSSKFDARKISRIKNIHFTWNNLSSETSELYKNEWMRSGSCISKEINSMGNQMKYFKESLKLYKKTNIIRTLLTSGIFPNSKEHVNSTNFKQILTKKYQSVPDIRCKYNENLKTYLLTQVWFCLTKDLKFMKECPVLEKNDKCPESFIFPEPLHLEGFESF